MSALARYFHQQGHKVAGYDRLAGPMCRSLEEEGISIHYTDDPACIPKKFTAARTGVIYTPAIPGDLREWNYLREQGYALHKRSAVLGTIAAQHPCLAIAGTHGKTTTSAMLAHILRYAGTPCTAFLGGVSTNYQLNFWTHKDSRWMVVEADEYDRSFLSLKPWGAVITATDADHLDIYGNHQELQRSFEEFAHSVKGPLLVREDLDFPGALQYGFASHLPYRAANVRVENQAFHFDLHYPEGVLENVSCGIPGRYNVENSLAAAALALQAGIDPAQVQGGLESFTGVQRRFEYHLHRKNQVYLDDYAHHPREIYAVAQALRELYPRQEITAIFQPHLYSRTRDFMSGFAQALEEFDRVILMDIYPARERPIPGITSQELLKRISLEQKFHLGKEEILQNIAQHPPQVLVTLGAGDIDQLVQPLKMALVQ